MSSTPIFYNDDGSTTGIHFMRKGHCAEDMAKIVDAVLDSPVDHYVYLAAKPSRCNFLTERGERISDVESQYDDKVNSEVYLRKRRWVKRFRELEAQGTDPLRIASETCRRRGKKCIAGVRVNDGHHSIYNKDHGSNKAPPSHLPSFLTGDDNKMIHPLPQGKYHLFDYAHEEVRDYLFSIIEEIVNNYDVDGIEMDFLRMPHLFSPPVDQSKCDIMTDYLARIRKLLDSKKSDMILAVRVPHHFDKCPGMGMDIQAWAEQGLIDFLSPSGGFCVDYNFDNQSWRHALQGTKCRLLTGIEAFSASRWDRKFFDFDQFFPIHQAEVRAIAANALVQGNDGFNLYNFCNYLPNDFPEMHSTLCSLKDSEAVYSRTRHYVYVLTDQVSGHHTYQLNAGNTHYDQKSIGKVHMLKFLCADGLRKVEGRMTLRIFASSMKDEYRLRLNGKEIDPSDIDIVEHTWDGWNPHAHGIQRKIDLSSHLILHIPLNKVQLAWENTLELTPVSLETDEPRSLDVIEIYADDLRVKKLEEAKDRQSALVEA